jgi:hypothetical protein
VVVAYLGDVHVVDLGEQKHVYDLPQQSDQQQPPSDGLSNASSSVVHSLHVEGDKRNGSDENHDHKVNQLKS